MYNNKNNNNNNRLRQTVHINHKHSNTQINNHHDRMKQRSGTSPNINIIQNQNNIAYGDFIRLTDNREGKILFIGTIGYRADEIWYGIYLDGQTGNCDGSHNGRVYFRCPPLYGLFVSRNQIKQVVQYHGNAVNRFCYDVKIQCHRGIGLVKYVGELPYNGGYMLFYGVELLRSIPNGNSGNYNGYVYFICKPFHGLFLLPNQVSLYAQHPQQHHPQHPAPSNPKQIKSNKMQGMMRNYKNKKNNKNHHPNHPNQAKQKKPFAYKQKQYQNTPTSPHVQSMPASSPPPSYMQPQASHPHSLNNQQPYYSSQGGNMSGGNMNMNNNNNNMGLMQQASKVAYARSVPSPQIYAKKPPPPPPSRSKVLNMQQPIHQPIHHSLEQPMQGLIDDYQPNQDHQDRPNPALTILSSSSSSDGIDGGSSTSDSERFDEESVAETLTNTNFTSILAKYKQKTYQDKNKPPIIAEEMKNKPQTMAIPDYNIRRNTHSQSKSHNVLPDLPPVNPLPPIHEPYPIPPIVNVMDNHNNNSNHGHQIHSYQSAPASPKKPLPLKKKRPSKLSRAMSPDSHSMALHAQNMKNNRNVQNNMSVIRKHNQQNMNNDNVNSSEANNGHLVSPHEHFKQTKSLPQTFWNANPMNSSVKQTREYHKVTYEVENARLDGAGGSHSSYNVYQNPNVKQKVPASVPLPIYDYNANAMSVNSNSASATSDELEININAKSVSVDVPKMNKKGKKKSMSPRLKQTKSPIAADIGCDSPNENPLHAALLNGTPGVPSIAHANSKSNPAPSDEASSQKRKDRYHPAPNKKPRNTSIKLKKGITWDTPGTNPTLGANGSMTPNSHSKHSFGHSGSIFAPLKQFPDSPFDIRASQEDFEKCANLIKRSCNNPRGLFKVLKGICAKLKMSDPKYRVIDPLNPAVQKKLFQYDGTDDFLRLLGFSPDHATQCWICPDDQPPLCVISGGLNVCISQINECNKSRLELEAIRKFSRHSNQSGKNQFKTFGRVKSNGPEMQFAFQQSLLSSKNASKNGRQSPINDEKTFSSDNNSQRSSWSVGKLPSLPMDSPRNNGILANLYRNNGTLNDQGEQSERGSVHGSVHLEVASQPIDDKKVDDDLDGESDSFQLQDIIWSLTHNGNNNESNHVRDVLLLCHPVFGDGEDILNLLSQRFFSKEGSALARWEIQVKCVSFLQHWLRRYYYEDFDENPVVETLVDEFVEKMRVEFENESNEKGIKLPDMLDQTISFQQNKTYKMIKKEKKGKSNKKTNKLLGVYVVDDKKAKNSKKASGKYSEQNFLNLDNTAFAVQITILDFENFCTITDRECLGQNWKSKDKEDKAPNICVVIEQFNKLSSFVQMTIINESNAKKRGKLVKKWIKIASELFELKNFQALSSVQSALSSTSIFRLKSSWKNVSAKYLVKFEEFKVIYSPAKNHHNLRKIHRETNPPMVPYTGIFLQDLMGFEEGNARFKQDGSVNFSKLMRLHDQIEHIQLLQKTAFPTLENGKDDHLCQFIDDSLSKYAHLTQNDIYTLSAQMYKKK